ncbi:MAG: hypothetical protein KA967_05950 [Methanoculleus sp.]|nr:hypothetical protein [Methanoculleus sp.]
MYPSEVCPRFIQQIYRARPDLKLSKTTIHKILFKVRATLPENDPDREHLPFYWYNYGPYSEVVESSIAALKAQGVLREEKTETGKSLLVLNRHPSDPLCVCEDASAVIGRITREIDPYHMETFIHQIYRDYAPYEFMPRYKVDFLAPFKGYRASRPEDQCTLNRFPNESITPALDRLEGALYDCEAVLMEESLFERFNEEFTAYVSGAGKAFDIARGDEAGAYPIVEATYTGAVDLWYTFAQGVRISDGGHDEYYNRKLGQWEQEYRESLQVLTRKVRAYTRRIREYARSPPSQRPGRRSMKILSSLVEGYFS